MAFLKNIIPQAGDLLRVKRPIGYYHFAIAVSSNEVVHFAGPVDDSISNWEDVKIRRADISFFKLSDEIEVNVPFDSVYSREEVVKRALSFEGQHIFQNSVYNLLHNNCEHFARYVYYNKCESVQIVDLINATKELFKK